MKITYQDAMNKVYEDEGGYTNDAADPGGPTNWGITIADARMYWKASATAADVKAMPKSVAEDIYRKHYADPIKYDELPAGIDYAYFDYGINSGISRSIKVAQRLVGVPVDGVMGPATVAAIKKRDPRELINATYDERLAFLKGLSTWSTFGKGWGRRVKEGRALALSMVSKHPPTASPVPAGAVVLAGGAAVASNPTHWVAIVVCTLALAIGVWVVAQWWEHRKANDGIVPAISKN